MNAELALKAIEAFAAQAPFGIWILDARGISVFANRQIYRMFEIPEDGAALGINFFEDRALETFGFRNAARRAQAGEIVDAVFRIQAPDRLKSRVPIGRTTPLALKIGAYALRSETGTIGHHVIVMEDVTQVLEQREQVRQRIHDLTIFSDSKQTRLSRVSELQAEEARLMQEIRALGAEPLTGP